jgi:type IV secretory pathway VirJ component
MQSLLKYKFTIIGLLAGVILASLAYITFRDSAPSENNDIIDEVITLANQHKLHVTYSKKAEKGLLLMIADKNKLESSYTQQFAALSYYVAVIDNQELLKSANNSDNGSANNNQCLNLAQKLTELRLHINAHFKLSNEDLPILVGIENGAASLYAALAQAEKKTFHAAVGINFTPQLSSHTSLCDQEKFATNSNGAIGTNSSLLALKSLNRLPTSFYVFQDKNLPANSGTSEFANNISNAKFTIAKEDNQTPLSEAIQILQWLDPRLADQISSDASDSDLPLIEVNVAQDKAEATQTMAIVLTGDGGWAEIDKELAKILAAQGIPTVGFDSLSYFWKARTPATTSQDIERVIAQYLEKWNKKQVILIGYSFGADVLPFVANNLSPETQQKISLIALLGMGKTAAFEFRLSSWMNADKNPDRLPISPEIEKMKWAKSICIYGVADTAANCLPVEALGVKVISMSGDHHFDEKYEELVRHIIDSQKAL